MISIPANYSTNMAAGYPVVYVIRFLGGTAYTFASRSGLTITSAAVAITPVYTDYFAIQVDGSLTEFIGEIDCSIDLSRGGAVAGMNETSLNFLNQGRFDSFVSTFDLEHRRIKIYEGFIAPAGTIDIESDMIQIYDGVVQDADQWDYRTFRIPCKDRRVVDDVLIPRRKIVVADYANCPKENLGSYIPFTCYGLTGTEYYDDNKIFLPTVQTKKNIDSTTSNLNFHVSDDVLTGVYAYYVDEDYYGEFDSYTVKYDDGTYIEIDDFTVTLYLKPTKLHGDSTAGLSLLDCVDGDIGTYETITELTDKIWFEWEAKNNTPGQLLQEQFVNAGRSISTDIELNFYVWGYASQPHIYLSQHATSPDSDKTAVNDVYQVSSGTWSTVIAGTGWHKAYHNSDLANGNWDNLWLTKWGFYSEYDEATNLHIGEVYLKVKITLQDPRVSNPKHTGGGFGRGRRSFGSQRARTSILINDRLDRPSGEKIVSNVFSEGTVARHYGIANSYNPAYQIKDILQYQAGVPSVVISNSDASTARASWYCQFVLTDRDKTMSAIERICSEHSLGMWIDLTGNYLIFPLDTGDTDFALTSTDIALDGAGIPRISISRTSSRELVNDMHIQYGYSHVHNKHMKNLYIGDVDGNNTTSTNLSAETGAPIGTTYTGMMNNSITKYRVKNTAEYNFDTIIDTTTAEAAIKKLADWLAYKKLVIKLDVMRNANTLTLRIGDIVTLNTTILMDEIVSNVKYFVTGINFPAVGYQPQPYFTLTLTEIPSAYIDYRQIESIPDRFEYTTGVA